MNIDIVTETYPPEVNGVSMTLGRLAGGLQRHGHRVRIFRPRQSESDVAQRNGRYAEHLLPGMRLPLYRELHIGFPAGRRFIEAWKTTRPDAIYVATEGPLGWSAVASAAKRGIPVVSGFHTNFHTYSRHYHLGLLEPLILRYLRTLHRRTRCTLAPTRVLAEQLMGQGFGRVEVLPRGVDTALFTPARRSGSLRLDWGAAPDDLVCLYVGRIAAEKNIDTAVQAFLRIKENNPTARLVLVGDGPRREALSRAYPEFVFCGMRHGEDLATHYASGDMFLFPSRSETFGNVVTEAMGSGLAVVAFNRAAAAEHIRHRTNGVVIDGSDDAHFVAAAAQLAGQPAAWRQLGAAAVETMAALDWNRVLTQFAGLLEEQALVGTTAGRV